MGKGLIKFQIFAIFVCGLKKNTTQKILLVPKYTLRSASFVFLSVFSLQFGHTHVSESSLLTIITFIQFPY